MGLPIPQLHVAVGSRFLLLFHLSVQDQLELGLVQLLVDAALSKEGIVGAPFLDDAARYVFIAEANE